MAPDIGAFVSTVTQAGGAMTPLVWQGLWHAWHYHRELPEAHTALDAAADWMVGALTASVD